MLGYKGSNYKKILVVLSLIFSIMSITGCFKEINSGRKVEIKELANSTNQTDKEKLEDDFEGNESLKGEVNLKNTRIKIKIKDQELIAVMQDNPTTRDFLSMFPLTMTFKDFSGTEKISYPPSKMSIKDAPNGYTPKKGDITCYSPWGNLAVFYKDGGYANGLIYMGHIESGIKVLEEMNGDFDAVVTIEK